MSYAVSLPRIGRVAAWRKAARRALAASIAPEEIRFDTAPGLFPAASLPAGDGPTLRLSQAAVKTIEAALCHSDPERFDRAYGLVWRMAKGGVRFGDRSDPSMSRMMRQARDVHRDVHKMHAFVRFREGPPKGNRRAFAAWFEPTHYIVEAATPFFANRFGDMDWMIKTPDLTAVFADNALRFEETRDPTPPPDDATEELWCTYYASIFNPARLMVRAMQSEMPRKFWKNLPEAAQIPQLIQDAPKRAQDMAELAATIPPARARAVARARARSRSTAPSAGSSLAEAAAGCTRCSLGTCATQVVFGEGPETADLMIVGEQPGDQEDLVGRPFVGPAGHVLDRAIRASGLMRDGIYLTNAVKHFKHIPRGKRRIHRRPDAGEVEACQWWLDLELERVRPKLVVALGATATLALTGSGRSLMHRRGAIEQGRSGHPVLLSLHPAFILRTPDRQRRVSLEANLVDDLRKARAVLRL